jgi:hypothetical protein
MVSFKDLRPECAECKGLCEDCTQSVLNCDGKFEKWIKTKKNLYIQTFKPYFDVTLGREVQSKREIREYCKRNDMVYAGDSELTQQCEQNKRDNAIKQDRLFEKNLTERLMSIA